jgi:hypothetical protein
MRALSFKDTSIILISAFTVILLSARSESN